MAVSKAGLSRMPWEGPAHGSRRGRRSRRASRRWTAPLGAAVPRPCRSRPFSSRACLADHASALFRSLLGGVIKLHGSGRHDGGDRMFVDELRMRVAAQEHAKIVEPTHDPLQFDAVHEKDSQGNLMLADMIEKSILQVLWSIAGHID